MRNKKMKTTKPKTENWEKKFDEEFPNGNPNGSNWWWLPAKELYADKYERVERMRTEIKSFIYKLLHQARQGGHR
jgi:hypothetical protein